MAKRDDDYVSGLLGGHRGKYSPGYRDGENTRKTIEGIFKPMSQASQAPSYTQPRYNAPPRSSYAGGSSSGSGSKAGGGFFAVLIVIGVLYAMAHSGGDKKQTAATQNETEQPASPPAEQPTSRAILTPSYADNSAASPPPAASGPSSPASPPNELAARNPDTPGDNVGSPVPRQTDATPSPDGWRRFGDGQPLTAIPSSPPVSATPFHPMTFAAKHKEGLGGCKGQLDLTSTALHFSCLKNPDKDLYFSVADIEGPHREGVILRNGNQYHFSSSDLDRDQVEGAIQVWWQNVQQQPRQ